MSSNVSTSSSGATKPHMPQPRSMQQAGSEQAPPAQQNARTLAPLIPADFEGGQHQQQYTTEQLTTPTQEAPPGGFGRGGGGPRSPAVPPPPYIPPTYDGQHNITSPNTSGPPNAYPRSPNTRRGGGPPIGAAPTVSNGPIVNRGGGTPVTAPTGGAATPGGLKGEDGEGVDPSKYKTKMCANFLNNACTWGSECAFAHGPNELRQPPPGCPRSPNTQGDAGEAPPPVNYQLGRTASWSKGPSTHQGGGGNPSAPPVSAGPSHGAPPPSYNYGAPPQHQSSNLGVASHQPPHSPTTPTSNGGNAPPPVYPTRYRHEPYSPSKAKTYISSNPTSPKVSDPGAYPTIPLGSPTE